MDSSKFHEAQAAYDAGDYRSAAKGFLASAGKGALGNGAAYHMAGNALMRLRRHADAVTVYGHALRDETYDKAGAVHANLGAAYVALGEHTHAIASYEAALADPGYQTPYKAWQGIASVYMERGRAEDAAIAYRKAALDETNPDPGKALVNLGLCFMALGRPNDAADAYKAALGFDSYQGRGRALANLGQAYAATGDQLEAVRAFEKATQLHGHQLSPSARADYERALEATRPQRETVEGWVTGEMPPVPLDDQEPTGWDTNELHALTGVGAYAQATSPAEEAAAIEYGPVEPVQQPVAEPTADDQADIAARELGFGDEAAVTSFFSLTEDEMKARAREERRAERASRGPAAVVRGLLTILLIVLVVGGLIGVGYWFGFGWPMQDTTVKGLFVAYSAGEPVEQYWVAVPDGDVKKEMAKVPPVKSFTVDKIVRGKDTSKASVTVTPENGAPLHYVVTLSREGVGWRVTGIDYNWRSTGG